MVLLEAAVGKAVDETIDAVTDKKKREKEADDLKQADVPVSGSLAEGESYTISFKSADKGTALRSGWPFKSVDVYNGSGQRLEVQINEVNSLILPLPNGAQNGDSFENVGVTSLKIINRGGASANLDDVEVTVSGSPSGVSRGGI